LYITGGFDGWKRSDLYRVKLEVSVVDNNSHVNTFVSQNNNQHSSSFFTNGFVSDCPINDTMLNNFPLITWIKVIPNG
jgi:hypothetical protein